MVVMLGWLGAEEKHLKRYAELYHSRGIRSVAFCIPVKDLLWFDLGRKVEERIAGFAGEIASWLSETEKDGRERQLLFHTFSNTGWLVYGAILENLQTRGELIRKIKGCVIDSGADPEINPQVWAAGFCAALLRKRSSLTYSSVEPIKDNSVVGDKNKLQMQDNAFPWAETMLLVVLEKFFSLILRLPDIHRRLSKILCILSKKSLLCPQLYLYSSADKVIPACSVELFIEQQRSMGRKVWAHNFCSSPHVDHFRSFPQIYSSKVHEFLDECTSLVSNNPKTLIP
ncbi:hypothetical protein QJS10_CPA03g00318 [Acorus calamus]|uniref:Transmembrane protein 53 n=1 Tax=Acorus calamus TaxID=4465 RepID=A0AAV9F755_ACOCL|nr:hypothetical protein QJS10_CPA03g00318 [Acorus calamus]